MFDTGLSLLQFDFCGISHYHQYIKKESRCQANSPIQCNFFMIEHRKEASYTKHSKHHRMIYKEVAKETRGDKCQEKRYCGQNKFKN